MRRSKSTGWAISGASPAILAVAIVFVLLSGTAGLAQELTSPSYRLRGGTLSGGGAAPIQSAAPGSLVGSGGTTLGQPGPVGISTGQASGTTLASGFWATVAEISGPLDSDGDGVVDGDDNCIDVPNGFQLDTDGDDFGNACDCDFDQDGFCSIADFNVFLPAFQTTVDPGNGTDMNGDGAVGIADFNAFLPGFQAGVPGPSGLAP